MRGRDDDDADDAERGEVDVGPDPAPCAVSAPARLLHGELMKPTPAQPAKRTARCCTDAAVTSLLTGLEDHIAVQDLQLELAGTAGRPARPGHEAELPARRQLDANLVEVEAVASSTVAVCAVTEVTWPTRPRPFSTVSCGRTPSARPASRVTVPAGTPCAVATCTVAATIR